MSQNKYEDLLKEGRHLYEEVCERASVEWATQGFYHKQQSAPSPDFRRIVLAMRARGYKLDLELTTRVIIHTPVGDVLLMKLDDGL